MQVTQQTVQLLLGAGGVIGLGLAGWNAWLEYRFRSGERADRENKDATATEAAAREQANKDAGESRQRLHVRIDEMKAQLANERIAFNREIDAAKYATLEKFVTKAEHNQVMQKIDEDLGYLRKAVDKIKDSLSEKKK